MLILTPNKQLLLLLLLSIAFSANIVNAEAQRKLAKDNSQCQICLDQWDALQEFNKERKCRNLCRRQRKQGLFSRKPKCRIKCCRSLCDKEDGKSASDKCEELGYCITTESPTESPTERASSSPNAGGDGEIPDECVVAVECYDCVSRGCYFQLGNGGGACGDCLPKISKCGLTGNCLGFTTGTAGRDGCLARMETECGDFLP